MRTFAAIPLPLPSCNQRLNRRASRLFLFLFAAKYQPATSLREKSCAADGSAERPGILLRSSEVLGEPAKNARTRPQRQNPLHRVTWGDLHVRMIPYNFTKCYYGYYLDSNCLHRSGCVPNRQFRPYTFKLLCFGGVSAAATVHIGTAPLRRDTMCDRHRSGATFFRPLPPRNPDLRFQVNRHRNSAKGPRAMRRQKGIISAPYHRDFQYPFRSWHVKMKHRFPHSPENLRSG